MEALLGDTPVPRSKKPCFIVRQRVRIIKGYKGQRTFEKPASPFVNERSGGAGGRLGGCRQQGNFPDVRKMSSQSASRCWEWDLRWLFQTIHRRNAGASCPERVKSFTCHPTLCTDQFSIAEECLTRCTQNNREIMFRNASNKWSATSLIICIIAKGRLKKCVH